MSSPVKPTFEIQYHFWPLSVGHCEAHRGSAESQWQGQGLSRSQYCLGSLPQSQPQVLDQGSEADREAEGPPRRPSMGGGQVGIP